MAILKVGYARVDITPTEPVPLAGYGNTDKRISNNILSHLYCTCIAFTGEDGNTVLLFHNDLINSPTVLSTPARESISAATGVPFEQIIIAATHTHSAPDVWQEKFESIQNFRKYFTEQATKCAVEAMADRKSAELSVAKTKTRNLNFVRHYLMNDGSVVGDNYGTTAGKTYVGHVTQADPEMRLVKFTREGGEDILLVNWQTHPHRTGGNKKYDISADIVGAMRDEVEAATGMRFIYFTGGAGNINPHSRIKEENIAPDFLAQGKAMAEYAIAALPTLQNVAAGPVRFAHRYQREPLNRPSEELLENAKKIQALWLELNDASEVNKVGQPLGIHSPYHANALIAKYNLPEDTQVEIPLNAFSIGDVAFATTPYETFDTNAREVREGSPFPMTVFSSCANNTTSYIPSAAGFAIGGYEADCTRALPGTGEKMANILVDMLTELHKKA